MITPDYCATFARYNAWMNEKLYGAAATLTDEARKRNLGAFFSSLHNTLAHLILGDGAWMRRFVPSCALPYDPARVKTLSDVLYDDFDEMREARRALDAMISHALPTLSQDILLGDLTYSRINGERMTKPLALCVVHFFNHQTHHRGQATTLLIQLGVDPGVTDLLWMPPAVNQ